MRERVIAYLLHSLWLSSRPRSVRRGISEPRCHKTSAVLPLASLLAGIFASTLCGQNVSRETLEARLGDLARKLPSQATSAPPSTAHRLGEGIQQTRATLTRLEARLAVGDASRIPAALRDEHRKLVPSMRPTRSNSRASSPPCAARAYQPELTGELAVWSRFTAHYRSRMDASLAAFDRLGNGSATPPGGRSRRCATDWASRSRLPSTFPYAVAPASLNLPPPQAG